MIKFSCHCGRILREIFLFKWFRVDYKWNQVDRVTNHYLNFNSQRRLNWPFKRILSIERFRDSKLANGRVLKWGKHKWIKYIQLWRKRKEKKIKIEEVETSGLRVGNKWNNRGPKDWEKQELFALKLRPLTPFFPSHFTFAVHFLLLVSVNDKSTFDKGVSINIGHQSPRNGRAAISFPDNGYSTTQHWSVQHSISTTYIF